MNLPYGTGWNGFVESQDESRSPPPLFSTSIPLSQLLTKPISAAMLNASTCITWLKQEKPALEEACETANNVLKAGKRATEIIDRLRSLYKKAPRQRESVDVNEIIADMVVMLRARLTGMRLRCVRILRLRFPRSQRTECNCSRY